MNKMKAWQGSYGISRFHGIVSPAYFVFGIKGIDHAFFNAAIRSKAYVPFFTQASEGVRIGQWDLSAHGMREIGLFVPTPTEQDTIVRFLDHADRRIRRAIRAKEQLIALLEEQKQALIHDAVTGRTDVRTGQPYPAYKPSGVDWLGRVPEHWDVIRLKNVTDIRASPVDKNRRAHEHAVRFLGTDTVYSMDEIRHTVRLEDASVTTQERRRFLLREGDLVLAKDSVVPTRIADVAIVAEPLQDVICGYHLALIRITAPSMNARYLLGYLGCSAANTYFLMESRGTTIIGLGTGAIGSVRVTRPTIPEQRAISAFLEDRTKKTDASVARIRREIGLLNEYRTRLIADVVTGKLDVRDAAAALPDEDAPTAGEEGHERL